MKAWREKGLCYCCDERFTPGHHCKKMHIYLIKESDDIRKMEDRVKGEEGGIVRTQAQDTIVSPPSLAHASGFPAI